MEVKWHAELPPLQCMKPFYHFFFFSLEGAVKQPMESLCFSLLCFIGLSFCWLSVVCWESVAGLVWCICLCTYRQPLRLTNFLWKRVQVNQNPLVMLIISPFVTSASVAYSFPNSSVDQLLQLCKKWVWWFCLFHSLAVFLVILHLVVWESSQSGNTYRLADVPGMCKGKNKVVQSLPLLPSCLSTSFGLCCFHFWDSDSR